MLYKCIVFFRLVFLLLCSTYAVIHTNAASDSLILVEKNNSDPDIVIAAPQKIFLHTDKNNYNVNEDLWISVFVVNSITHNPDTLSSNVFVDLINYSGERVMSKIFLVENGFANGNFFIPDTLPDGNYMISAYTEWIRYVSDKHSYSKNIYITNYSQANYISRESLRKNVLINEEIQNLKNIVEYNFLTEGGKLIANVENMVLFRLTNGLGQGIRFIGEIHDQNQAVVADIKPLIEGYGVFNIKPEFGKTYYASLYYNQENKTIPLIKAEKSGINLRVTEDESFIYVDVQSSEVYNESFLTLYVKQGLSEVYNTNVELNKRYEFKKSLFPSGVSAFHLKDEHKQIIAERLYFVFHNDIINIGLDKNKIISTEKGLNLSLSFSKHNELPVTGMFSLSMHYLSNCNELENIIAGDNIVNSLFVKSDIKNSYDFPADISIDSSEDIKK